MTRKNINESSNEHYGPGFDASPTREARRPYLALVPMDTCPLSTPPCARPLPTMKWVAKPDHSLRWPTRRGDLHGAPPTTRSTRLGWQAQEHAPVPNDMAVWQWVHKVCLDLRHAPVLIIDPPTPAIFAPRHWCPVMRVAGQCCCIFRTTNLGSAALMLAATADRFLFEFLQMCSRPGQGRLAVLHLLVDGHTLGCLGVLQCCAQPKFGTLRVAQNIQRLLQLLHPITCLGLLDVRIHKWTQPCVPGVVLWRAALTLLRRLSQLRRHSTPSLTTLLGSCVKPFHWKGTPSLQQTQPSFLLQILVHCPPSTSTALLPSTAAGNDKSWFPRNNNKRDAHTRKQSSVREKWLQPKWLPYIYVPIHEFWAIWEHPPILSQYWQVLHQLLLHHTLVILQKRSLFSAVVIWDADEPYSEKTAYAPKPSFAMFSRSTTLPLYFCIFRSNSAFLRWPMSISVANLPSFCLFVLPE